MSVLWYRIAAFRSIGRPSEIELSSMQEVVPSERASGKARTQSGCRASAQAGSSQSIRFVATYSSANECDKPGLPKCWSATAKTEVSTETQVGGQAINKESAIKVDRAIRHRRSVCAVDRRIWNCFFNGRHIGSQESPTGGDRCKCANRV